MIAVIVLLTLILIVNLLPILLSLIAPKQPKPVNLENDLMFLNFIIGIEIEDYKKYVINTAKAAGRALMSDEDLNRYREEIVIRIYAQMSPNYRKILNNYFSDNGLEMFIINRVNNELTRNILGYNSNFFNKKKKDDNHIIKTDIE